MSTEPTPPSGAMPGATSNDIAEAIDVMFHCEKAIGKANAEKFVLLVSRLARERDEAAVEANEANNHRAVLVESARKYYTDKLAAEAKSARLAWQPIPADFVTLNPARTVMVARLGERLAAQAIRSGIKGGWRHAHCGEALCFEPTHYIEVSALALPEPSHEP